MTKIQEIMKYRLWSVGNGDPMHDVFIHTNFANSTVVKTRRKYRYKKSKKCV